jgi:hypothetical protein
MLSNFYPYTLLGNEKKLRRENKVRESMKREKYDRFDMLFGIREIKMKEVYSIHLLLLG